MVSKSCSISEENLEEIVEKQEVTNDTIKDAGSKRKEDVAMKTSGKAIKDNEAKGKTSIELTVCQNKGMCFLI